MLGGSYVSMTESVSLKHVCDCSVNKIFTCVNCNVVFLDR